MSHTYDYEDFIWLRDLVVAHAKTSRSKSKAEAAEVHFGFGENGIYAEPGCEEPEAGCVVLANWNNCWSRDAEMKTIDDSMERFGRILEALGADIHWSDMWTDCVRCSKLVQTEPDSYGWKPSYRFFDDEGCVCVECLVEEAGDCLESLEGKTFLWNAIDQIDPEDHGYIHLQQYERGMHRGQDADPKVIGDTLSKAGFSRFLFNLDSKGQFDCKISVWLHEDEAKGDDGLGEIKALRALEEGPVDGPSISAAMERGLREAASQGDAIRAQGDDGILVSKVTMDGATTKVVSREDFEEGKALD